jgi:hypothetical protein
VGRTGIILLGEGSPGTFGEPPQRSLLFLPVDTDTHVPPLRIGLGRGVWTLVPDSRSDSVMVYDRSSETALGAKAIRASTGEMLWERADGIPLKRMRYAGRRALGLTEEGDLLSIDTRSGEVEDHRTLPPAPDGGRWTAWAGTSLDDLVLAGASASRFFVGRLDGARVHDITSVPAAEAFVDQPRLPPAVANIQDLEDGRHLLILGGDGESASPESTPCVAAVVSASTKEWAMVDLDPDQACCAVLEYDGGWLVQCGNNLRLLRRA